MTDIFSVDSYSQLKRKDGSTLKVEGNFRAWDTKDNRLVLFIEYTHSEREQGFTSEYRSYHLIDAITLKRVSVSYLVESATISKYFVLMDENKETK
jgi:hypothetical protein